MKSKSMIFIVICMVLCMIPSVGMLFFPTTRTTENKPMAPAPKLVTEEGSLNRSFFQDFESYINEHIALRNPLVYADAKIQTGLFGESNVSGVISGTDGWLYYASTLDDFLGNHILSERELYNLASNFALIQDYVQRQGMEFAVTIAPNKNTLYPENMPYYKSRIMDPDHSAILLEPYLRSRGVSYVDLFALFEAQEEVLYLKRDSHWNNKGACLVYEAIMADLGYPYENYSAPTPAKIANGDLNKMLYSFYGPLEEDYDYGLSDAYTYEKEGTTVEDGWIVTHNPTGSGTLLMFRDSFANTLIPFFSGSFETACYSKGLPNALERMVETYEPDCVVLEKVERNLTDYLQTPPILTGPKTLLPTSITVARTSSFATVASSENDVNYYQFSGSVDPERLETDSQILAEINGNVYRVYQTGENGFLLYLKKAEFAGTQTQIKLYTVDGDVCTRVLTETLSLPA